MSKYVGNAEHLTLRLFFESVLAQVKFHSQIFQK